MNKMLGVFWLTTDCNMKCVYCYEGSAKGKLYMSDKVANDSIEFLIKQCKRLNDEELNIDFHGGEPLLAYNLIVKLVEKFKERCADEGIKVKFGCTTNGTLLTEDRLKFIHKEISDFTISMDGAAHTQNYSRPLRTGKDSFGIADKWLKRTLYYFPYLRVRMTFNSNTVGDLYENIKYFSEIGVKYIVPERDFYDDKFGENELEELKKQLLQIKHYFDNSRIGVHVSLLEKFPVEKKGRCSGGVTSFHIDPKGDIYPCALSVENQEFLIGNIERGVNIEKRNLLLSYSDKENPECVGCDFIEFCEQTRCKIVNKLINGDYHRPSSIACVENSILLEIS